MIRKLFPPIITILVLSAICPAQQVLTLDRCIELALQNNTTVLNAEASLKDYNLIKTVARSDFMPSLSASLGYTHSQIGKSSQEYVDPLTGITRPVQAGYTSRNYSSGLSLNQTIYDGGYTIANYQRSIYQQKAAGYEFENTRQEVIYKVEETYLELLRQKHLLEVYRETIRSSEESLKRAESMERIGAAPHSDVLKAKVQLENDRMNFIRAENKLELAKANLNYIIGFDVNSQIEAAEIQQIPAWNMSYEEAVAIAGDNHPILKQIDYQLESAQKQIRMAESGYLPQFSGRVNYSWYHEDFDKITSMFEEDYNWSASLNLSISLFEGFSRPANVSRAKIGYRTAQVNELQYKRDVMLGVKTAYLQMFAAKKQIEVANESLISAEEDLKQSSARYQLGAGTMLEQIDAQVAVTTARVNKIQAEYDYRLAVSGLKKAMGVLNR